MNEIKKLGPAELARCIEKYRILLQYRGDLLSLTEIHKLVVSYPDSGLLHLGHYVPLGYQVLPCRLVDGLHSLLRYGLRPGCEGIDIGVIVHFFLELVVTHLLSVYLTYIVLG